MPEFDIDAALGVLGARPLSKRWRVTLEICMPDQGGNWTRQALNRECENFDRVAGPAGETEMDWLRDDYGDILFVVKFLVVPGFGVDAEQAEDRAVDSWESLAPACLSQRCSDLCGFAVASDVFNLEDPDA